MAPRERGHRARPGKAAPYGAMSRGKASTMLALPGSRRIPVAQPPTASVRAPVPRARPRGGGSRRQRTTYVTGSLGAGALLLRTWML